MRGHRLRFEFAARTAVELVGGAALVVDGIASRPLPAAPMAAAFVVLTASLVWLVVTAPYLRFATRAAAWDPHATPRRRSTTALHGALIPLLVVLLGGGYDGVAVAATGGVLLGDGLASLAGVVRIREWERRAGTVLLRHGSTFSADVVIPGFNLWWGHAPAGDFLALGERPPRR